MNRRSEFVPIGDIIPEVLAGIRKPHIFEFWPHLSERQPREVAVSIDEAVYSLADEFPGMPHGDIEILHPYIDDINAVCSIGMQRESDEWSTNYVFLIKLSMSLSDVRPTRETKKIIGWPIYEIAERAAASYSPTIKGDVSGKLVPNTVGMLALYILAEYGQDAYTKFMKKMNQEMQTQGYAIQIIEYNPSNCPFRKSS